MSESPSLCTLENVLLLTGTIFAILLTTFEMASIAVILGTEIYLYFQFTDFALIEDLPFKIVIIGLIAICGFLLLVFILQYNRPFSRIVAALRHSSNLLFSALAIWYLVLFRKSQQPELLADITGAWNTSFTASDYERRFQCLGLSETDTNSCLPRVSQDLGDIFTRARFLIGWIGIFWAAIMLYGAVGIVIVIASPKRRI
jgi:hypothetical protein